MPWIKVQFSIHKKADGLTTYIGHITHADTPMDAVPKAWEEIRARKLYDESLDLDADFVFHCSAEDTGRTSERADEWIRRYNRGEIT